MLVGDDRGNPAIQETVAAAKNRASDAELGVARSDLYRAGR